MRTHPHSKRLEQGCSAQASMLYEGHHCTMSLLDIQDIHPAMSTHYDFRTCPGHTCQTKVWGQRVSVTYDEWRDMRDVLR